ncbi:MAG: hypothetical protein MR868_09475 [Lachnospiraceae bacterium]|nr:hypothetical protein [Lachnospiraceae bacterium]
MKYISKEKPQFKANLHSHSTLSDGRLTPDEMARVYRAHGYSILAVTDHEVPCDHSELTTPDFLMLTGYEAYIRVTEECVYDLFKPEIHMNLIAKTPHNTTSVNYNPQYDKYMSPEMAASRKKVGDLGPRRYEHAYIQKFIDTAREAGYLVTYNHPCWSMEREEDVLNYDGFFSLEIFNSAAMVDNGYEINLSLYDKFLRRGKFLYCHGADDNHNKISIGDPLSESFGAWTMVLAEKLTYPAVVEALEKGNFYASTGPMICELLFTGEHVHLECSPAKRIMMHISPKKSVSAYNKDGSAVSAADFDIPKNVEFVYFSVHQADGTSACTRAFRREEWESGI